MAFINLGRRSFQNNNHPFFVHTNDNIGRFKVVVVGDKSCGKTSLLNVFVEKSFRIGQPRIFESSVTTLHFGTKTVDFVMWDLSGCNEYDGFRYGLYQYTDLFLVCFDIGDRGSLEGVTEKWIPELFQEGPNTPFLLVGCKSDLRLLNEKQTLKQHEGKMMSTKEEAERIALKWGAKEYVECCAKSGHNITTVFRTAAQVLINTKIEDKASNHLLKLGLTFPKFYKRKSGELGEMLHHYNYSLTNVNGSRRRSSASS